MILPDAPVSITGSPATRLREVARDGFLLLAAGDVDAEAVLKAARRATSAPVRLLCLTGALDARPGEVGHQA
ncbi:hypothetical protein ACFQX6_09520 [Streptosporangium lutulentum]